MGTFDVIIGAGPAGAMAGYTLGQTKLRTLLINKSTFPCRKICGGGLTHRAYRELPFDITPFIAPGTCLPLTKCACYSTQFYPARNGHRSLTWRAFLSRNLACR